MQIKLKNTKAKRVNKTKNFIFEARKEAITFK